MCMVPGCERPAKTRGLCDSHYQSARNSINNGKTTWEELVRLELSKDVSSGGVNENFNSLVAKRRQEIKANTRVTS
jgi:hypothetical protein